MNDITNLYHPIMTKNVLLFETVAEISLCRCKTGCTQRRCTCKKNNLLCTEMFLCVNSSNEKSDKEKIHSNSDVQLTPDKWNLQGTDLLRYDLLHFLTICM